MMQQGDRLRRSGPCSTGSPSPAGPSAPSLTGGEWRECALFVLAAVAAVLMAALAGCGSVAPVTAAAPRGKVPQITEERSPYGLGGEIDAATAAQLSEDLRELAAQNARPDSPSSAAIKAAEDLPGPRASAVPGNRRAAVRSELDETAKVGTAGADTGTWADTSPPRPTTALPR